MINFFKQIFNKYEDNQAEDLGDPSPDKIKSPSKDKEINIDIKNLSS